MQELHLIGYTTDRRHLIFSTRQGAKSGSFLVPVNADLLAAVADLGEEHDEQDEHADDDDLEEVVVPREAEVRVEAKLSVREVQARLRSGEEIDDIAERAGVDPAWVERFAPPIRAEQRQIVERALTTPMERPRAGLSSVVLRDAVSRSMAERDITFTADTFGEAWSARLVGSDRWAVEFSFVNRGRPRTVSWTYDAAGRSLTTSDRFASQIGFVAGEPASPPSSTTPRSRGRTDPTDDDAPTDEPASISTSATADPGSTKTEPARTGSTKTGSSKAGSKKAGSKKAGTKKVAAARKAAKKKMEQETAKRVAAAKRAAEKKAAADEKAAQRAAREAEKQRLADERAAAAAEREEERRRAAEEQERAEAEAAERERAEAEAAERERAEAAAERERAEAEAEAAHERAEAEGAARAARELEAQQRAAEEAAAADATEPDEPDEPDEADVSPPAGGGTAAPRPDQAVVRLRSTQRTTTTEDPAGGATRRAGTAERAPTAQFRSGSAVRVSNVPRSNGLRAGDADRPAQERRDDDQPAPDRRRTRRTQPLRAR